ncbi:MAG: peroxide stress protein YaaA [Bacteroidales bacterium]
MISPQFRTWKDGKPTTIVVYTKMARGEMARHIIKNRIERIEDLHWDINL